MIRILDKNGKILKEVDAANPATSQQGGQLDDQVIAAVGAWEVEEVRAERIAAASVLEQPAFVNALGHPGMEQSIAAIAVRHRKVGGQSLGCPAHQNASEEERCQRAEQDQFPVSCYDLAQGQGRCGPPCFGCRYRSTRVHGLRLRSAGQS